MGSWSVAYKCHNIKDKNSTLLAYQEMEKMSKYGKIE